MAGLSLRLREAENRQRQLRHQLDAALNRSAGPFESSYSGHSSSSVGLGLGSPVRPLGHRIGTSHNTSSSQESAGGAMSSGKYDQNHFLSQGAAFVGYNGTSHRRAQFADLDATPRPHRVGLHSQPDNLLQQQQQQRQQPQEGQAAIGSKDNAAYLPMVMENIMAEHHRHEREGTLRSW
jgi:hypothetical protein